MPRKSRLTKYAAPIIIPPENGWKPGYYVVDVAWSLDNPIHRAIFNLRSVHETGFPVGTVWNGTYEEPNGTTGAAYLGFVSEIPFGKSEIRATPSKLMKESNP